VSVKVKFCSVVDAFGLVTVKVRVVVAPSGLEALPNALLMLGGPTIWMVAVLLATPGPLSVEEIAPVVLDTDPGLPVA